MSEVTPGPALVSDEQQRPHVLHVRTLVTAGEFSVWVQFEDSADRPGMWRLCPDGIVSIVADWLDVVPLARYSDPQAAVNAAARLLDVTNTIVGFARRHAATFTDRYSDLREGSAL